MVAISKSVGKGGVNILDDVETIQKLLNKIITANELIPLKVDGDAGDKTIGRIEYFQQKKILLAKPDGLINPNDETFNKLIREVELLDDKSKLRLSDKGLDLLKSIEELATTPYDDQTGKDITAWVKGATIGYGHLIAQSEWSNYKNEITEAQAIEIFKSDLAPFENVVNDSLKVVVPQNQFDALVILAFNIGINAIPNSSVLKLVNNPATMTPYPNLESAWKSWNKSQGVVNAGLINRRQAEWNIYSRSVYKKW